MVMTVPDQFDVNHPDSISAVAQGIADWLGVLELWLEVILTALGGGRRLVGFAEISMDRRLAANVKLDYTVTIPPDSSHTGSSISNTISAASNSQVTAAI